MRVDCVNVRSDVAKCSPPISPLVSALDHWGEHGSRPSISHATEDSSDSRSATTRAEMRCRLRPSIGPTGLSHTEIDAPTGVVSSFGSDRTAKGEPSSITTMDLPSQAFVLAGLHTVPGRDDLTLGDESPVQLFGQLFKVLTLAASFATSV